MPEVVVRADGSPIIGMGHLVRSFSLAKALTDLGVNAELWGTGAQRASLLDSTFRKVSFRELPEHHYEVRDFENYSDGQAPLIVTDGYFFPKEFYKALDERNISYGVIDDNGETQATSPAFILNQNPSAESVDYRARFPQSELYLGLGYALIRNEILDRVGGSPVVHGTIFIAMGGSDPLGLTLPIVGCLEKSEYQLIVALGSGHQDREQEAKKIQLASSATLVQQEDYVAKLAEAEVVILGAGSSLWEANVLCKKTVAVIVADNQIAPTREALQLGIISASVDARSLSMAGDSLESLIKAAISRAKSRSIIRRVSRGGAQRVALAIRRLLKAKKGQ